MAQYVLALDQGTTGNTALVLDAQARIRGRGYNEFRQIFPEPAQVEHDPADIWNGMRKTISDALVDAGIRGSEVAAIGITNQRETVVLWERGTGRPLHRAIVWQDRRTAERCAELRAAGRADDVHRRTGLVIDPYFSGTKAEWLLNHHDADRQRAEAGELMLGTIDTYLLYQLTGGEVHATEPSNASRTLLMNIDDVAWDTALLDLLGVPAAILPEIRPTSGVFGTTKGLDVLPDGIPVGGMAGDQQAALFGQACFHPGQSKCTYGTGAFLLLNTGTERVDSQYGILTTVAWQLGDETTYAMEGSSFIAGAAVQWLRDGLGLIERAADIEALAQQVPDAGGVVFVPALTGLGAPHWRAEARGVIHGMTRGTTRAHVARATLEGIAFQITDLIEAMNADARTPISELRVDGGATQNDLLMQLQADLARVPIIRPANIETTAFGAGFLAGLATGVWSDREDIARNWQEDRRFAPAVDADEADARRERWRAVVAKA